MTLQIYHNPMASAAVATPGPSVTRGVEAYYSSKVDELEVKLREKSQNLRRLEAQRNELNAKGMI